MNLIIVESPTKARTLSRFLGRDYQILATMGHVKDLPKSKLGVDVDKNFAPVYVVVEKKMEAIKKLISGAKKSGHIFVATDPDREGEAIAGHVYEILKENDVPKGDQLERIVFHEITKEAVEHAIAHPRGVDRKLIDAQVSRRVLDRLVGYNLSPLLWKKVRRGLSAGRVQTVAVRLIVEREREIEAFKPVEYWEIFCEVKGKRQELKGVSFVVKLIKIGDEKAEIKNKKTADMVVGDLEMADYSVAEVKKKEVVKRSFPPFTTSTMTQAAARIFFWSAKRTMSVAQKLYESGLITYHRTDSTNISSKAIAEVREYIVKQYGQNYLPETEKRYKTKSKIAQEAHEAIRPTSLDGITNSQFPISSKFHSDAKKLYGLIWKRFVACQMAASVFDETTIDVVAKVSRGTITRGVKSVDTPRVYTLRATGQVMKFDGWRVLYEKMENGLRFGLWPGGRASGSERKWKMENKEKILPQVKKDEELQLINILPEQKFTQPPARFSEAMLIKTLEKMGIGRPSTYAPTISTIQDRQYVEKDEGRFKPTPVGTAVNDFLLDNFPDIFDYDFTAKMEDDLDNVAKGEVVWTGVIGDFWKPFEKKVITVEKESQRVKIPVEKIGKKCPLCKKGDLVIRIGRFGKFISCSDFPECKYTEKHVDKIGMKCPECGKGDVVVKITRKKRKFYGCSRYPKCKYASWKNPKINSQKNPRETQRVMMSLRG